MGWEVSQDNSETFESVRTKDLRSRVDCWVHLLGQFGGHPGGILIAQFAHHDDTIIGDLNGGVLVGDPISAIGANSPFATSGRCGGLGVRAQSGAERCGVKMPEGGGTARGVIALIEQDQGEKYEHSGRTNTNCEPHGIPWPDGLVWRGGGRGEGSERGEEKEVGGCGRGRARGTP